MTSQIRSKFKSVHDFMPVLISVSLMKSEFIVTGEKMETPFSPFNVNGNAQGRITPSSVVRSGRNSNLS